MGTVLFRDKITIFRVFAAKTRQARRFFRQLKESLKEELNQEEILLVEKEAKIL